MGGGGRSAPGRWDWVPVAVCACYEAAVLASVLVPGFPLGPAVPMGPGAAATALAAAASAGGLACVAVRRARPATAALIAVGSYAASTAHGAGALLVLPAVICLYSLGRHAPSRAAAPVGAVCAAATGLGGAAGASGGRGAEALASFTTFALVCCCGMVLRARERARETQRRGREAALRAASLEQERNLALARSRVAAELHDSVGHGLTTIIVLSEGLTRATGDAEVDEALAGINAAARECLEQTREAVRALGRGGGAAAGPERHTWDDVHSVIASARSTGMAVAFHESGRRPQDEGQADLAFAVAREGITNALRHARGASVVTVSWVHRDDGWVEACVRDDGTRRAATTDRRRQPTATRAATTDRRRQPTATDGRGRPSAMRATAGVRLPSRRPTRGCRWSGPGSWRRAAPARRGGPGRAGRSTRASRRGRGHWGTAMGMR